jgi:hypothetical protein
MSRVHLEAVRRAGTVDVAIAGRRLDAAQSLASEPDPGLVLRVNRLEENLFEFNDEPQARTGRNAKAALFEQGV